MGYHEIKNLYLTIISHFLAACSNTHHSETEKNVLTVYSPYPANLIRPILNDFEKQEHVKIEIKRGSTQVLLSNLHKEKLSERGDVFMGVYYQKRLITQRILYPIKIVLSHNN